jgi:oligopeptide/dipeptide ABC transporter ATP-binding protein
MTSDTPATDGPVLEVKDLVKHFPIRGGLLRRQIGSVRAVDGVSLDVAATETLGVVGESGCGKTTLGRTIIRLHDPTSGQVLYKGEDVTAANSSRMRELRKELQIVFQDPFASLNPRMPVADIVGEPLRVHGMSKRPARDRVSGLLEAVGLSPEHGNRYPHEFSGGQRQRIGIARSLALNPTVIILDEPVSALDVSVQAQVLNLLEDLQDEFALSYLFIAHDLSVVRHISDRVMVMYLGMAAELADRNTLYEVPAHPYTHSLLSAVPVADPDLERSRKRIILEGDLPSPANPPPGCRFNTRCPIAEDICKREVPEFREVGVGHWAACHFPLEPGEKLLDRIEKLDRSVGVKEFGEDDRTIPDPMAEEQARQARHHLSGLIVSSLRGSSCPGNASEAS